MSHNQSLLLCYNEPCKLPSQKTFPKRYLDFHSRKFILPNLCWSDSVNMVGPTVCGGACHLEHIQIGTAVLFWIFFRIALPNIGSDGHFNLWKSEIKCVSFSVSNIIAHPSERKRERKEERKIQVGRSPCPESYI